MDGMTTTNTTTADPFGLLRSWLLALEAEGKARATVDCYRLGVVQLADYLTTHGHPVDLDQLDATQLRQWLVHLGASWSDNTVRNRYNGVRLFLTWCVTEGELTASPMDTVRPPVVREKVVPMLTADQLRALLDSCASDGFTDRRDLALLSLMADTGARLSEVANLRVDDIDLQARTAQVLGKGSRPRTLPFGAKAARALDRYLRVRRRQARADLPWLWLGSTAKGRMTPSGVRQALQRRGRRIGVHVHPHQLRHGFADAWLKAGGSELDLMSLAGWRSRQMVGRYAAANRAQRARDAHRRLSPLDRMDD